MGWRSRGSQIIGSQIFEGVNFAVELKNQILAGHIEGNSALNPGVINGKRESSRTHGPMDTIQPTRHVHLTHNKFSKTLPPVVLAGKESSMKDDGSL